MPICPFATWDPINGPVNSYTGVPYRIVHHVTDGGTYAGARETYALKKNEPHFTVDAANIYQHIDTGKSARALKNPAGGVETNRANAVQIEVVGFTAKPKNMATLRNVAKLCRWIESTHGVPRVWPNGVPKAPVNGKDPGGHNRNAQTWVARGGHYGHCHVPENDHWDPGYTDAERAVVMGEAPAPGAAPFAEAGLASAHDAAAGDGWEAVDAGPVRSFEPSMLEGLLSARAAAAAEAREQAFAELERAEAAPYYDEKADQAAREEYYRGLDLSAGVPDAELYAVLRAHLQATHRDKLDYKPPRHLFSGVDLHPDGKLHSIYTGDVYDPRQLMEEAFAAEAEFMAHEGVLLAEAVSGDPERETAARFILAADQDYDCEHVVPQAWFSGGDERVPRGDLHHLFACKKSCNNRRGSVPFWEFPEHDPQGAECGRKELNRFEPAEGKGPAARAVMYFLLRYPGYIADLVTEFQRDRLPILLAWHQAEPPTVYEWHRNAAIHQKKGNRNPLVDFPQLASRIDFTRGLGAP